ncbi:hypothetical protein Amn_pc01550 (plasmid) [Aminobacter sp. Y103A]|nr:hypothetical protein Amn_pc01550 [Aminobacter sp. SS-2016]
MIRGTVGQVEATPRWRFSVFVEWEALAARIEVGNLGNRWLAREPWGCEPVLSPKLEELAVPEKCNTKKG